MTIQLTDDKVTFKGELKSAWDKLVHWQTMHEWDPFMERVTFGGPLELGSVGLLKMKGGPQAKLVVTAFNPPISYTDQFTMLGSTFIFHHELIEAPPNQITLHIWVEASGALASLLAPMMRKEFAAKMPLLMNNFKQQYEQHQALG